MKINMTMAMSEISDRHIIEFADVADKKSTNTVKTYPKDRRLRFGVIAACFALMIIMATTVIPVFILNSPIDTNALLTSHATPTETNAPETTVYTAFTAYISGGFTEGSGQIVQTTHRFRPTRFEDIPEPEKTEISFSFMGKQYNAVYTDYKTAYNYGRIQYTYQTEQGDKVVTYSSGEIVRFETAESLSRIDRYTSAGEALPIDELLIKAKGYMAQIFGEETAARYELSNPAPDTTSTKVWFFFKPKDNARGAYTTTERFTMTMTKKGEFLHCSLFDIGAFADKKLPDDFTDDRVKQIILNSLTDEPRKDIELSESRKLIILEGDKMACILSFCFTEDEGAGEWVSVVIPLE